MKILKIFATLSMLLAAGSAMAANPCKNGFNCTKREWRSLTCQELRNTIVNHDAVKYGATYKFNTAHFPRRIDQMAVCRAFVGRETVVRQALTVSTSDQRCPLWDIAFRCERKPDGSDN